jgi:hypothetical protein
LWYTVIAKNTAKDHQRERFFETDDIVSHISVSRNGKALFFWKKIKDKGRELKC